MIRSLTVDNYRGFKHFELRDLGRVNLIVGTNNAGKTSLLEAIHILEAVGQYGPMILTLTRRGEDYELTDDNRKIRLVEFRHLFHGHDCKNGDRFNLSANTDSGEDSFSASIPSLNGPISSNDRLSELSTDSFSEARLRSVNFLWHNSRLDVRIPGQGQLTDRGGLFNKMTSPSQDLDAKRFPTVFLDTTTIGPDNVPALFQEIVLTPYEDAVLETLRIIEPAIERIAIGGMKRHGQSNGSASRGGLLLRCKGMREPIPIGSMGDGIWRLLGLALALARCEGGILLVDEIDTGLHYTVMEDMWKLITVTAKKHNIQVFATSHSRDCYESLAAVCNESVSKNSEVTIQRIEKGKSKSVAYSEQVIVSAAAHGTEVR